MGGSVSAGNNDSGGARFCITIPLLSGGEEV